MENNTKYDEKLLDWEKLKNIGITKEELEKTGDLNPLLNGEETKPISIFLPVLGVFKKMQVTLQIKENNNKVEVRYAFNQEDLHKTLDEIKEKKRFALPDKQSGHEFKPSEHEALQAGKTIKIEDMVGADGLPIGTKWLNVDQKNGYLNFYAQDPDAPKQKNTIETPKQEQGKSRGVV